MSDNKSSNKNAIQKFAKEVKESNPCVQIANKVLDHILEDKKQTEKDHRDFLDAANKSGAKKATKCTKRSYGVNIDCKPGEGTITANIGSTKEDTTTYER